MCRLSLILTLALALNTQADIAIPGPSQKPGKKKVATPLPRPPEPVPLQVEVRRGESVAIPLKVIGMTPPQMKFRIINPPEFGTLSDPVTSTPSSGLVTYKHSGELTRAQDQFSFRVQTGYGLSTFAKITVKISDEPVRLVVPDEIDFGTLLAGATVVKDLQIVNKGGGVAVGEVKVSLPVKIEPDGRYTLGSGDKKTFRLTFASTQEEEFQTEIQYSSDPGQTTLLRGKSRTPLAVAPRPLILRAGEGTAARAGILTIENRLETPQTITLQAGTRLLTREQVDLRAGGKAEVLVETASGIPEKFNDTLKIGSNSYSTEVAVQVEALKQPRLSATRQLQQLLPVQPASVAGSVDKPVTGDNATTALAQPEIATAPAVPETSTGAVNVRTIKVTNITRTSCELAWNVEPGVKLSHTITSQTPVLDNGEVQLQWVPLQKVSIKSNGNNLTAAVTGLVPGTFYRLRVESLADNEPSSRHLSMAHFRTIPPAKRQSKFLYIALVTVVALVGIAVYARAVRTK